MRVNTMIFRNFRNYSEQKFVPGEGVNIIFGDNAQGKTNLLEGIFLCAFGKSHRATRDVELVMEGQGSANVRLTIDDDGSETRIDICIDSRLGKRVMVDGERIKRIGELMGCLNVLMFSPESLSIIKGSPSERRRFMDMDISQMGGRYFHELTRYNALQKQRNAMLKEPEALRDTAHVRIWDEQLANSAAAVVKARKRFLDMMTPWIVDMYGRLCQEKETITIEYVPSISYDDDVNVMKQEYIKRLCDTVKDDIRRGYTTTGPHRDDIDISIAGKDAKVYASQGQQRTAALAMKLSGVEFVKAVKKRNPVILLDDVFSELDEHRCKALLSAVSGCQCMMTCAQETFIEGLDIDYTGYCCKNGHLTKQ